MKLTKKQAQKIVWGESSEWETVEEVIEGTTRWSILRRGIFKHKSTNKLYSVGWSVGATEMQDESPFEYKDEVEFKEVEPVEVTVIQYKPVN